MSKTYKKAIVLFNLGGPDKLDSVKPFLFNLFNDKNIITLPSFLRWIVAFIISNLRAKTAKEIYSMMGGGSTILSQTEKQALALKKALLQECDNDIEVFICMRHWHPMTDEVLNKLASYRPDEIILLPLYPHFSTTTTASSIDCFLSKQKNTTLKNIKTKAICCYPEDKRFIEAHVSLIKKEIENEKNYIILFSAHGLPEKTIDAGDPYQWQITRSVNLITDSLKIPEKNYKITYQSKVGPMKWLSPNTEDEIVAAVSAKKDIIIVPIAFVSEHSETLVELDIEYKKLAKGHNIKYKRVCTLGINEIYIKSLTEMVKNIDSAEEKITSSSQKRLCPKNYSKCPCR